MTQTQTSRTSWTSIAPEAAMAATAVPEKTTSSALRSITPAWSCCSSIGTLRGRGLVLLVPIQRAPTGVLLLLWRRLQHVRRVAFRGLGAVVRRGVAAASHDSRSASPQVRGFTRTPSRLPLQATEGGTCRGEEPQVANAGKRALTPLARLKTLPQLNHLSTILRQGTRGGEVRGMVHRDKGGRQDCGLMSNFGEH